jgi:hypothetical protein
MQFVYILLIGQLHDFEREQQRLLETQKLQIVRKYEETEKQVKLLNADLERKESELQVLNYLNTIMIVLILYMQIRHINLLNSICGIKVVS